MRVASNGSIYNVVLHFRTLFYDGNRHNFPDFTIAFMLSRFLVWDYDFVQRNVKMGLHACPEKLEENGCEQETID